MAKGGYPQEVGAVWTIDLEAAIADQLKVTSAGNQNYIVTARM